MKIIKSHQLKSLSEIIAQKKNLGQRLVATFDADGTLWKTDMGEGFFKFLIREKKVPLPLEPWNHYHEWKKRDLHAAYLWLAQILKGVPLVQVRAWAQESFNETQFFPFFPEIQNLLQDLRGQEVEVFVVTASIKWAVEPGAKSLGIPPENVLGVETEVVDCKVTDRQRGFITSREGKKLALQDQLKQDTPFLCVGNSTGDLELLRFASQLRVAIQSTSEGDELFHHEQGLQDIAEKENWIRWKF